MYNFHTTQRSHFLQVATYSWEFRLLNWHFVATLKFVCSHMTSSNTGGSQYSHRLGKIVRRRFWVRKQFQRIFLGLGYCVNIPIRFREIYGWFKWYVSCFSQTLTSFWRVTLCSHFDFRRPMWLHQLSKVATFGLKRKLTHLWLCSHFQNVATPNT